MSAIPNRPVEGCPICMRSVRLLPLSRETKSQRDVLDMLAQTFPDWEDRGGLCSDCYAQFVHVQHVLPESLRDASGRLLPILPVRVRLRAQTDLTARGVTIAFLDSGFHPHPDLIEPRSRILAYHNVLAPERPVSNQVRDLDESSWHGLMTSVVCAGNGRLSQGFYRGLASSANLVLVKVGTARRIKPEDIERGLTW
ncbi:MAG: hypothetical protein H6834_18715, partial [Planctomycetes bacterium]|nr:hypothetical protein [Planctomycetota bacterium]